MTTITLTQVIKDNKIKLDKGHKNIIGMRIKAKSNELGHLPMFVPEKYYQVNAYPEDFAPAMLEIIREQIPILKNRDKEKKERKKKNIAENAELTRLKRLRDQAKEGERDEVRKETVYKKVIVGKKPRPRIKK